MPPNSTVVGIPGKVVKQGGVRMDRLSHQLPDPVVDTMRVLQREIEELQEELRNLKKERAELHAGALSHGDKG
ncbi:Serine acetyltransferase [compost metagenome]